MELLRKALREPLLHCLAIGAGLFFLFSFINGPAVDKPDRIVVSPLQMEQLAETFARTWMRPPDEQEMDGLIDGYLRDEVYYREAIALGLDQDDTVIRRRMRQKLEFILEDVSALAEPTDEALTVFMHKHGDRFRLQPKVSFQQIYLSPDERQDIEADADAILARLQAGETPETLGDPMMMLGSAFKLVPRRGIESSFGEDFARQLLALPPGSWSGPIGSGFGAHLVRVSEREEGRLPELAEVRDEVERDWSLEQRKSLKEATFRKLLEGYEVVMQQPAKPVGSAAAAIRPDVAER